MLDSDTAVEVLGQGYFAAQISPRWFVTGSANGGYLAAIVLRAMDRRLPTCIARCAR